MHEDKELLKIFLLIADLIKPSISIEVGGFDSVYSQEISKKDYCDEVYAYEANPITHENFKHIFSEKVNYINLAISDYQGKAQIGIETMRNPAQGHYSIKSKNAKVNIEKYIEVDCNYLDNIHKYTNEKIAMWIDCEGANGEVLTGSKELLKNVEILLIETETKQIWQDQWTHQDVINYLEENGFYLYKTKFAYVNQENAIFLKKKWINVKFG
jgi:FkbM family methyltransferase